MNARPIADLIDTHAAGLGLYARQWCATPEDAIQDVFCKLAALRQLPDDPAAYLYRAVRNAAIDRGKAEARRRRREQAVARPERWFEEPEIDGIEADAAVAALTALADNQRELIVARLWGGLTLEQAATAAGCSVSTAHRRYEAGIAVLRQRLRVSVRESR